MFKKIRKISLIIVITILLMTACATQAPEPTAEEQVEAEPGEGEPIKIGFISAFTGVFSSFGMYQREGAELALEEFDYEVSGRPIEVIYEDDQLDNELAITKAKKLVEQDQVDILTGLVSGDEGLTVQNYVKDKGIPLVPMYSASEDNTMREFYPLVVRQTWTGAQSQDVFGYWLA